MNAVAAVYGLLHCVVLNAHMMQKIVCFAGTRY